MSYAQRGYNEPQGINPKYRINQIGCFLTSFSNLLLRFDRGVDPLTLNRIFKNKRIWLDTGDGAFDDLAWTSISKHDKNIVVTRTGTGIPPHRNAIVKFTGDDLNSFGTHFCLVQSVEKGLIIDSWDGQIKSWDVYGGPKVWAAYEDRTPDTPPKQSETVAVKVVVQPGWGITHVLKSVGYSKKDFEDPKEWRRVAKLNNLPEPLRLYPGQVLLVHKKPLPTVVIPAPKPNNDGTVSVKVVPKNADSWKRITPENKTYIARKNYVVKDLSVVHPDLQLLEGQKVTSGGFFVKDSIEYVVTKRHTAEGKWYGIPRDVLGDGQDPNAYVGPLVDEKLDVDLLYEVSFLDEMKEAVGFQGTRERFLNLVGKVLAAFSKVNIFKRKNNQNKEQ